MFGYVLRCQVICIALYKCVGNLDSFFGSVNTIAYRTLIFCLCLFKSVGNWFIRVPSVLSLLCRRMNLAARD